MFNLWHQLAEEHEKNKNKITERDREQRDSPSQEQGLDATCETKVLYLSGSLPAELSVQSASGHGAIQGVSQLLTESMGSFIHMRVEEIHFTS